MTHISEFDRNDSDGSGRKVPRTRVLVAPAGAEFKDAEWTEIGHATLDSPDFESGEDLDWQPPCTSWTTTFPIDPESDSPALLMGNPTRAELEQQIEDLKREVQFWKQMVDDVAEDYERELEKAERGSEIDTEAVADAVADILAGYYRAL